ncbi:MAG: hypothetical protein HY791_30230 [Deltaproteobacteria bacterium]|nr:hypothetical protein [Deltaproteobacteria bacterium]
MHRFARGLIALILSCAAPEPSVGLVPRDHIGVLVRVSGEQLEVTLLTDHQPTTVPFDGPVSYLFLVSEADFVGFGGKLFDSSKISARASTTPAPAGSCGRCPVPVGRAPAPFGPGFDCAFPAFGSASVLDPNEGTFVPFDLQSIGPTRRNVRLDYEGPCELVGLDPTPFTEVRSRPIFPPGPSRYFPASASMPNGSLVLFGEESMLALRTDGTSVEAPAPVEGTARQWTATDDSQLVLASDADFGRVLRLDVYDRDLSPIITNARLPATPSTGWIKSIESVSSTIAAGWGLDPSPRFVMTGNEHGVPAVFLCRIEPIECDRITPPGLFAGGVESSAVHPRGLVTVDAAGRVYFGQPIEGHWQFDSLRLDVDEPRVPSVVVVDSTVVVCLGTFQIPGGLKFFAGEWVSQPPTLSPFFEFPHHRHCHTFFAPPSDPRSRWMRFDDPHFARLDIPARSGQVGDLASFSEAMGTPGTLPVLVGDFEFAGLRGEKWVRRRHASAAWELVYEEPRIDGSEIAGVVAREGEFRVVTDRSLLRVDVAAGITSSTSVTLQSAFEVAELGDLLVVAREEDDGVRYDRVTSSDLLSPSFVRGAGGRGDVHMASLDKDRVLSSWELSLYVTDVGSTEKLETSWDDPMTTQEEQFPSGSQFQSVSSNQSIGWAVGMDRDRPFAVRVIPSGASFRVERVALGQDSLNLLSVAALRDGSALLASFEDSVLTFWILASDGERYVLEQVGGAVRVSRPEGARFIERAGQVVLLAHDNWHSTLVWPATGKVVEWKRTLSHGAMGDDGTLLLGGRGPRLEILEGI